MQFEAVPRAATGTNRFIWCRAIVEAAHRSKQITYHYVTLDVMQQAKMHGLIAICILTSVHLEGTGASAGTTEANSVHHADATFREPNLAAPDLVLAQVAGQSQESLRIDEDELLAAIVSAHISEPDRVAGVLKELRLGLQARVDRPQSSAGWTRRSGPR
jgi:hypothetical protein